MKQLILLLVVALPTFFSSAALAGSTLDAIGKTVEQERVRFLVAASDQSREGDNKEEEEEPDCE